MDKKKSPSEFMFAITRLAEWCLNSDPDGQIFLSTPNSHGRFFFFCIPFLFLLVLVISICETLINILTGELSFFAVAFVHSVHGCSYTLCSAEDKSCHFVNLCLKCFEGVGEVFRDNLGWNMWNNIMLKLLHSQESLIRFGHQISAWCHGEITWLR